MKGLTQLQLLSTAKQVFLVSRFENGYITDVRHALALLRPPITPSAMWFKVTPAATSFRDYAICDPLILCDISTLITLSN